MAASDRLNIKVNNLEKNPNATNLIHINQYYIDKRCLEEKMEDIKNNARR